MIKSPKEKFLASKVRQEWEKITETQAFEQACDYALLQMLGKMPRNLELSADAHMQMVGAQNFIHTLKTIHETTQEPPKPTSQGLNYNAGV